MSVTKRFMAAAFCAAFIAVSCTSCGKKIKLDSSSSSSSSSETSASSTVSNDSSADPSELASSASDKEMNFTAPQKGETVIVMTVKGKGDIKIKLFPDLCPKGVENFIGLAKKGYYDGLTFHRVIKDFMIQGGDPKGDGTGGESMWGGSFDGGVTPNLGHFSGAVAYANSGSTATDGSQFYIVTGQKCTEDDIKSLAAQGLSFSDDAQKFYSTIGGAPWLDGGYTVFGQVFDGLDIVYDIQNVKTVNPGTNDKPVDPVTIESVKVTEYDGSAPKWYISDYKN